MPPKVEQWLRKPNVTPIAMAPHGVRQMTAKGIECEYVPHAIDTKVYKPTFEIGKHAINDYLGIKEDDFLIGVVAANKASGLVHRKAFGELLMAFSIFSKEQPDALLYLHTDAYGMAGGWNLIQVLQSLGIPKDKVLLPNPQDYRFGMAKKDLAAIYTRMDVLLAPSTDGQPAWDAGQDAWWQTPNIPSLVNALKESYYAKRGPSQVAIDFAKDFDIETVWDKHWVPVLKKLLK